jgi:signal transduction histidine kinase
MTSPDGPLADSSASIDVDRIAGQQAALLRMATLVARGVPADELFGAVTREVGTLLETDLAGLIRFEPGGWLRAVATWAASGIHPDVSGRWPLDGDRVATQILRTGAPAREDAWDEVGGPVAAVVRERLGVRSSVGSPIVVEGQVWGALFVHLTQRRRLPPDTESRLGHFAKLVATAIANAQARVDLQRLADEQGALLRVAELVARGAPPAKVFETVAEELGMLTHVEGAKMLRYEPDATATFVASWGPLEAGIPVGTRLTHEGTSVTSQVFATGQPARVEDYASAEGTIAEIQLRAGMRSAVGAPIRVDGRLWGALLVGSVQSEPLPPDTEGRVAKFADLVAAAIANTEARADLQLLAREQSALRRVATLVAQQTSPDHALATIAAEIARLLEVDGSVILRYETDGTATVLASWGEPDLAAYVGTRLPFEGDNPAASVWETWRPERQDGWEGASGRFAELSRQAGITSAMASPVLVEGKLWGAIVLVTRQATSLPDDTERRTAQFTELVAAAIGNVKSRAELTASRARIVRTSDEARRRFERDLHDGIQQRLVSVALDLRGVAASLPTDLDEPRAELARIAQTLSDAFDDLRELSRGLHPAILRQGGLRQALAALARRSAVPVDVRVDIEGRLAEPVEVAVYFVVSEALANAAKHARASAATVSIELHRDTLRGAIADDGVGGADPARGSGLVGLIDRVEALGGTLDISSVAGRGTTIRVELPVTGARLRSGATV